MYSRSLNQDILILQQ